MHTDRQTDTAMQRRTARRGRGEGGGEAGGEVGKKGEQDRGGRGKRLQNFTFHLVHSKTRSICFTLDVHKFVDNVADRKFDRTKSKNMSKQEL